MQYHYQELLRANTLLNEKGVKNRRQQTRHGNSFDYFGSISLSSSQLYLLSLFLSTPLSLSFYIISFARGQWLFLSSLFNLKGFVQVKGESFNVVSMYLSLSLSQIYNLSDNFRCTSWKLEVEVKGESFNVVVLKKPASYRNRNALNSDLGFFISLHYFGSDSF